MKLELIKLDDRLFEIYRVKNVERIKDPKLVKDFWNCDIVLKRENNYYFCNEIPAIEYELLNNENNGKITDETPA